MRKRGARRKAGSKAAPEPPAAELIARVREALLAWYSANARDLPWRRTRDPYAIWISEVMLQQTTVAVATPYWERFLEQLPDVGALAEASEERVLELFAGLGYYRRARMLHEAARALTSSGRSELPQSAGELRELPGIGAYTAAAIASIAHKEAAALVDGNVERVLARLLEIEGDPKRQPARGAIAKSADALLAKDDPGTWNQALMELGALVCKPRDPACASCPLESLCAARRSGRVAELPTPPPRSGKVEVIAGAMVLEEPGPWCAEGTRRVLVRRLPAGGPNAGLHELPGVELARSARGERASHVDGEPRELVAAALTEELGVSVRAVGSLGRLKHGITHHRITLLVFSGALGNVPEKREGWRFVNANEPGVALSSLGRRGLALAAKSRDSKALF